MHGGITFERMPIILRGYHCYLHAFLRDRDTAPGQEDAVANIQTDKIRCVIRNAGRPKMQQHKVVQAHSIAHNQHQASRARTYS